MVRGQSLHGVAGLVIRNPDGSFEANPPAFVDDLDRLPAPDPHRHINLLPYRLYSSPLQIQTKRGCALACSYCTYNRLEGSAYRLRDPEAVAAEIERGVRATGIRDVEIVDSTFNLPLDHAKAVLRAIIDRNLRVRVSAMGMQPRYVDAELVGLMRRSGFVETCLGIEAGSDPMLRALGKNFTVADVRQARQALRGSGIPVMWFLLLGAPGETRETIAETFRTVDRVAGPLDLVNIGVGIRVYKGAPIAGLWLQDHPGAQEDFLKPRSYVPPGLDIDEIMDLAAAAAGTRPRYFMYGGGAHIPLPVRLIVRTLFPRQPIWRIYILARTLAKYTGLLHLHAAFERLARAATRRRAPTGELLEMMAAVAAAQDLERRLLPASMLPGCPNASAAERHRAGATF